MREIEYATTGRPRTEALRSMERWKRSPEYRARLRASLDIAQQLGDCEGVVRLRQLVSEAEILKG